ncbi:NADPH:quinone reductase [Thalassobacillus sp. C254]|uniref:NADPH:quinone reductase n=1 Tax=Thalassobacillus sp. C254 TaxID=1225341 RepID=UPI0006D11800|nr:NADPH:quinone reductase [Thalassobacillus sp. C254]
MKAAAFREYGGPEVLKLEDLNRPEIKEDNEILIKVEASGVNPVDTYFRAGIREVPQFPHIPHFDLAGTIEETGEGVSSFNKGDRVWGTNVSGTAAEYAVASEDHIFPLPDNISFEEGASLGIPVLTAHLSLFHRAGLKEGETVLIYGASGAVGHAAVQMARLKNAKVIATAGNEEKEQFVRQIGADHVVNYKDPAFPEKIKEMTDNQGVDVILDVSLSENIENDLEIIKVGGRIVTIGSPKNNTPELPWRLLNQKQASLLGILLFTTPVESIQKAGQEVTKMLKEETLVPHLGKTFPLSEASKAHQELEENKVMGNIVLTL